MARRLTRHTDRLSHLAIRCLGAILVATILVGRTLSLFVSLSLRLFLLLLGLPLLADFFELFGSALRAMRLHRNVRVQMVQGAVGLLATVPTALVHALNLFIPSAGSLVLLRARNGNERVYGGEWVTAVGGSLDGRHHGRGRRARG